jgi:hypothetical protein
MQNLENIKATTNKWVAAILQAAAVPLKQTADRTLIKSEKC